MHGTDVGSAQQIQHIYRIEMDAKTSESERGFQCRRSVNSGCSSAVDYPHWPDPARSFYMSIHRSERSMAFPSCVHTIRGMGSMVGVDGTTGATDQLHHFLRYNFPSPLSRGCLYHSKLYTCLFSTHNQSNFFFLVHHPWTPNRQTDTQITPQLTRSQETGAPSRPIGSTQPGRARRLIQAPTDQMPILRHTLSHIAEYNRVVPWSSLLPRSSLRPRRCQYRTWMRSGSHTWGGSALSSTSA